MNYYIPSIPIMRIDGSIPRKKLENHAHAKTGTLAPRQLQRAVQFLRFCIRFEATPYESWSTSFCKERKVS